jgi:hypothetical protein
VALPKARRTRPASKKTAGATNAASSNTTAANAGGTPAGGYLFNHKALAKVFRAKVLNAIELAGLTLPDKLPSLWVVDCKCVGDGSQALLYLGRYLYRGVLQVLHLRAAPSAVTPTAPQRPAWRCACGQPMRVICRRMPALDPGGDCGAASSHTAHDATLATTHNNSPGCVRSAPMH